MLMLVGTTTVWRVRTSSARSASAEWFESVMGARRWAAFRVGRTLRPVLPCYGSGSGSTQPISSAGRTYGCAHEG